MEDAKLNSQCIMCILSKYLNKAPSTATEAERLAYSKRALSVLADADNSVSAPEIVAEITAIKNEMFGFSDDYAQLKVHYNSLMLSFEENFQKEISASPDSLLTAIRFCLMGNYIDFGALDSVDEARLAKIPQDADKIAVDDFELQSLKADLEAAERLVYLTDNCGEIVMDKLLIGELKKLYPKLSVEILVRGAPVLNDATMEDALMVGLDAVAPVFSNGTSIAGTCIGKLRPELKEKLENADVIISKGQGNFETLQHCGLNVYYMFLCKCDFFAKMFDVPRYTAMLLNDKRI